MTLINLANINNRHPCVHFINNIIGSLVSTHGNEENLVALLVYSSFVRVATCGFRIFPYSLVVVVAFAQMRSDSAINPYSLEHGIVIVLVTSPD